MKLMGYTELKGITVANDQGELCTDNNGSNNNAGMEMINIM